MKKTIVLQVISMQLLAEGAVIITKPSADNPSKNGVHQISAGQLSRIARRTLGVDRPIGLKHMIDVSNGSAKLSIEAELCKAGDTYTKPNGETGTYGDKDWTKYSNHAIELGAVAKLKLAELSLGNAFQEANYVQAPKAVVVETPEANPEV